MSAPHQRRGLGRGLGALIPTAPRPHEPAGQHQQVAAEQPTGTSADWIGTPLPDDHPGGAADGAPEAALGHATVTVPDSPAGLEVAPGVHGPDADLLGRSDDHRARQARMDAGSADEAVQEESAAVHMDPSHDPAVPREPDASTTGARPGDHAGTHVGLPVDTGAWFAELPVDEIRPNPRQPREVFDEDAMAELIHSIREVGLLQPVVVRPVEDGYELVMGERRWRATREAGLPTIPAIVRETGDDDLLRDALLENLHRAQLNALEEAAAYQQLLEDFGCTHDELASRIGRSRPQISNTLRLLKLPPPVQRRVAAGVLSAGHARALLAVPDADQQDRLAGRVVAEGISVRSLEELVAVGDGSRAPVARRSRPTAPGVDHLAVRLSDRLDTRVNVQLGRRKGRITVEFASLTDLERIVGLIEGSVDGSSS